jgi:hypothetical protein
MTTQEMLDILLNRFATDSSVLAVGTPHYLPNGGIGLEVCMDSSSCTYIKCFHLFGSDEMLRDTESIMTSNHGHFDREFFRTATLKAAAKGHQLYRSFTRKLFPLEAECADRFQDFAKRPEYTSVWFLNEAGDFYFPKTLITH